MRKAFFPVLMMGAALLMGCNGLARRPLVVLYTDQQTAQRLTIELEAYRQTIEADGLCARLCVGNWPTPETLRDHIRQTARSNPNLEGVILIGDIPIPMIRDAQHLTSAFKMDQQRFDRTRSSVPSDRFYDDFDLEFDYLGPDSLNPLCFFYSLAAASPQTIEKEIYSARIIAPVRDESKYALLAAYLSKVTVVRRIPHRLDQAVTFTGHGYYSEDLSAWEGELLTLREQLPHLFNPPRTIRNYYHTMDRQMKAVLLSELQRPDLDLMIFHAHGGTQAQYLIGLPPTETAISQIEAVQSFLRNKLREVQRRRKPLEAVKAYYSAEYDVPESWFDRAFDELTMRQDSLQNAAMDFYPGDIQSIAPQPRVIMFDECFNGAFQQTSYMAAAYLFNDGATLTAIANSVNIKQDIWATENLGVLAAGARIGEWHRHNPLLESHLLGDPTFRFHPSTHFERRMVSGLRNLASCQKAHRHPNPNRRGLIIDQLAQSGHLSPAALTAIYDRDPSHLVRLKALKNLALRRDTVFEAILPRALNDPYELIRRFAAMWAGVVGHETWLPVLIERYLQEHSRRVAGNIQSALEKIGPAAAAAACSTIDTTLLSRHQTGQLQRLRLRMERSEQWLTTELLPALRDTTLKPAKRIAEIRTFRNYPFQPAHQPLIETALNSGDDPAVRCAALEALGWFTFSWQRRLIIDACRDLASRPDEPPQLRLEAVKTLNRLIEGSNYVFTP